MLNIFPAIDIIGGRAVRLVKGDYAKMTVYGTPLEIACGFEAKGAEYLHIVDLDGAKSGETPNFETVLSVIKNTKLKIQIGGGVRNIDVVKKYLDAGAMRVILGTAAVTSPGFLEDAVGRYGEKIAVGVDVKDGMVAIKGWQEKSAFICFDFLERLEKLGVKTVICTDISKDGMLAGANHELYSEISHRFSMDIIASGGVSSIDDVKKIKALNMYGAILGKALYERGIDLAEAIAIAKDEDAL